MQRSSIVAWQGALLSILTVWALLIVGPEFSRLWRPLPSTGFATNNDGLIYDVQGPFTRLEDSPAWQAGLRIGDRLDLQAMRCGWRVERPCVDLLAVLGGMGGAQLVQPGRVLRLQVAPSDGSLPRAVDVAARQPPASWLDQVGLLFNEVIATLFILAAAWLTWTRPGGMTWGFFLYAIWFNSGQDFVLYAFLQERPYLLLAQEAAGAALQGLGYAGFLLFVLRVPSNRADPALRRWEAVLPAIVLLFMALQLLSYASAFGHPGEMQARATFLAGFGVDAAAILVVLRRRRGQPPHEYQRLCWILWGCVIGLPAFIIAALLQSTTLWRIIPGLHEVPPQLVAVLYGLHGLLGWFVFEAVRRPRVVSVSIPLRRVTVFGLLLSAPALLLHREIEHLLEWLNVHSWGFIVFGSVLLFLIGRAHEFGVGLADRVFNHAFHRQVKKLHAVADDVLRADTLEGVDAALTDVPLDTLGLASAVVFRRDGATFRRYGESPGWSDGTAEILDGADPALSAAGDGLPFAIEPKDASRLGMPAGLGTPVLGVPVADRLATHAIALYGPHATGADLSRDERAMLARLATVAALAYRRVDAETLRRQLALLQARMKPPPLPTYPAPSVA